MAARLTVALLTLSCVILVTRYWRAQGERESCLGTLDQHMVRLREMKEEAGEERADLQSQIREQETELENTKREKITAESKLRLCESQSEQKDKHIRFYCQSCKVLIINCFYLKFKGSISTQIYQRPE